MTVVLYSYNRFSEGGKELARTLGIKRVKHHNSRFRPKFGDVVINWGCSDPPPFVLGRGRILNNPRGVALASNKLSFMRRMSERNVPTPMWTTEREIAEAWLNEDHVVVARTILNGHSARGLIIVEPGQRLPNAPMYTKYFKKKYEYRVHVGFGEIIDVQRKARRTDLPDDQVNWRVRNLDGGFIYARHDIDLPAVVRDVVNSGFDALPELCFGAYDVIYNERNNEAVILEVNTAPGISGTTVQKYAQMFEENL